MSKNRSESLLDQNLGDVATEIKTGSDRGSAMRLRWREGKPQNERIPKSNRHAGSSVKVSLGRLDVVDGDLNGLSDKLLSKEPEGERKKIKSAE